MVTVTTGGGTTTPSVPNEPKWRKVLRLGVDSYVGLAGLKLACDTTFTIQRGIANSEQVISDIVGNGSYQTLLAGSTIVTGAIGAGITILATYATDRLLRKKYQAS
jgi:hypothetical protein